MAITNFIFDDLKDQRLFSYNYLLRKNSLNTNIIFNLLETYFKIEKYQNEIIVCTGSGELRSRLEFIHYIKSNNQISPVSFAKTLESNCVGQLGVIFKSKYINYFYNDSMAVEMAFLEAFLRLKKSTVPIFIICLDYLELDDNGFFYPYYDKNGKDFGFGASLFKIDSSEIGISFEKLNFSYLNKMEDSTVVKFLQKYFIDNESYSYIYYLSNKKNINIKDNLNLVGIKSKSIIELNNDTAEYPTNIGFCYNMAMKTISKTKKNALVINIKNNYISIISLKGITN